jgi:hypothetical protein
MSAQENPFPDCTVDTVPEIRVTFVAIVGTTFRSPLPRAPKVLSPQHQIVSLLAAQACVCPTPKLEIPLNAEILLLSFFLSDSPQLIIIKTNRQIIG